MSPRSLSLHLALTPGIGGRTVARVVARNELLGRTPVQFLKLAPEVWREEYRLTAKTADNLFTAKTSDTEAAERDFAAKGLGWITAADAHYPERLEEFDTDPPGVLFVYGNQRLLSSDTFCVLGSRGTTPAGLDQIESLTESGVLAGEVLVSGHDRPEYQRSAVVPLRWGSPRILCLDRGMYEVLGPDLKSEAFRAARLWRYEFDPKTDLVVSPFRPSAGFHGVNNQVRDRLVAGLSRRIDLVNVAPKGNMERIGKMALKCQRPLRVPPDCELLNLGASSLP